MRRLFCVLLLLVVVWRTLTNAQDANGNGIADRIELPGTQPTLALPGADFSLDTGLNPATDCLTCHTTMNNAGPAPSWSGSMMGNAARDPVFWAQLDVAEADEATDPNLAGARDICLRCHIPKGWLEGRSSSAPLATALRGMAMQENDLFGVQCSLCHRLVDRTSLDVIDGEVLAGLNTHPAVDMRVPPSYGNGMYVVDRFDVRRGPFGPFQIFWANLVPQFLTGAADWPPPVLNDHSLKDSALHRSGNLCGTCHDVSNPAQSPLELKGDVQANFPIERTWTEWTHSGYPAKGQDGSCQACHMNGVQNAVLSGGVSQQTEDAVSEPFRHLNDVHFHDFTGGNAWVPRMIAQLAQKFQDTKGAANPGVNPMIGTTEAERDAFLDVNLAWVLKTLYPLGTFARSGGLQQKPPGFDGTHDAASVRAEATLRRAAQLSGVRPLGGDLAVRVWNMTGHKLPTGYPEGRRMWLDVKFQSVNAGNGAVSLVAQSGEYNTATGALYQDFNLDNLAGPKAYDVATYTDGAGTALGVGRRTQVYEARLHHTPSGVEFHFIRNNERVSDNRIPPIGWNKAQYQSNLAEQIIPAAYSGSQMVYEDAVTGPAAMPPVLEETYNFDEVAYPVPANTDVAEVTLQYQSVSREYIEELVAANPRTLIYPAMGGLSTFTRGDLLEWAWRTFSFDGQTRMPPVEMARLRIALVDADGDGLADNWETANGLNPASAAGIDGRHGDLDADGRSNWIEFQENTPANVADALRLPLDLGLVLDFSGSMSSQAPAGNTPKVEVLQDAVDLFLKTWKQYAIKDDRLAVSYFASNVAVEGGGIVDLSALAPGVTVESQIDSIIAAVRARVAGGTTAMGGGLQTALNLITTGGLGHRKQVIVFTNGMQNMSPMVRKDASDNYLIQAEAVNPGNGVFGDSGVTDAGGPAFGTALSGLSIPVHTIGIGVSETADDRWQALLSGISTNSSGLNQFISRGFELEGAFLNNLVQALRGFSPVIVRDFFTRMEVTNDSKVLEFPMDAHAVKATFILSWAGAKLPGRLRFDLTGPDGRPAIALTRVIDGRNYQLAQAYFPLANALGRPVGHAGSWRMTVRRESADVTTRRLPSERWSTPAEFRAYMVADVPEMSFDVRFSKARYRAGEEMRITARVREGLDEIRTLNKVTAVINRPRAALGTLLARTRFDQNQLKAAQTFDGDVLPDLSAAKSRLLLTESRRSASVQPVQEVVELFDDGDAGHGDSLPRDGIFSARLGVAHYPGLIEGELTIDGANARNGTFGRRLTANAFISEGPFSARRSTVLATRAGSGPGGTIVAVRATPKDTLRNYLGPGYRDRVKIEIAGVAAMSEVEDRLDGSYTRRFEVPANRIGSKVSVSVDDESVFDGSVGRLLAVRLSVWVLLFLLLAMLIWFAVWLSRHPVMP
jgi:hypothetical protein